VPTNGRVCFRGSSRASSASSRACPAPSAERRRDACPVPTRQARPRMTEGALPVRARRGEPRRHLVRSRPTDPIRHRCPRCPPA
jgi:hypothetical protein